MSISYTSLPDHDHESYEEHSTTSTTSTISASSASSDIHGHDDDQHRIESSHVDGDGDGEGDVMDDSSSEQGEKAQHTFTMPSRISQFFLLLWKNLLLKRRRPFSTLSEIFIPLVFILPVIMIRRAVPPTEVPEMIFSEPTYDVALSGGLVFFLEQILCACAMHRTTPFEGRRFPRQTMAITTSNPILLDNELPYFISEWKKTILKRLPYWPYFDCYCDTVERVSYIPDFVNGDKGVGSMFTIFNTSAELDAYIAQPQYGRDPKITPIGFAVIFDEIDLFNSRFSYTIRVNASDIPYTWTVTNPKEEYNNYTTSLYFRSGVPTLKMYLDSQITAFQTRGRIIAPRDVHITPFPIPQHRNDKFAAYFQYMYGLFFILAFTWPFSRMVRHIVEEKEKKIKEGMLTMGLHSSAFWSSWIITYFLMFSIILLLMMAITSPLLFPLTNPMILFLLYGTFLLTLISLACLMSSFFSRAKTAGLVSPFLLKLLYTVYFSVAADARSYTTTLLSCLLSPVAFTLGTVSLIQYEAASQGIQWSNWNECDGHVAVSTVIAYQVIDFIVYAAITVYLDMVIPHADIGARYPFYFPLLPSFWRSLICPSRRSSPASSLQSPLLSHEQDNPDTMEVIPPEMDGEIGVKIRNLRKVFNKVTAVESLNLNLYKGQLFVLLGHNGAGKSTTLHMLTGMFPPTSGTAEIFGYDMCTQMPKIRSLLGVCPQHNVLFDDLSVEEHLIFFARLKNVPRDRIATAVDVAMEEVQLTQKRHAAAAKLSGGQKRRLSLAIALIGDSKVVFLDEPTSGVDPFSRRAIWNLLSRKKSSRVIILTTHHMDEADQLGDRIGILHKGTLRCCGSPLFLKHVFGVGYNLVLTKRGGMRQLTMGTPRESCSSPNIANLRRVSVTELNSPPPYAPPEYTSPIKGPSPLRSSSSSPAVSIQNSPALSETTSTPLIKPSSSSLSSWRTSSPLTRALSTPVAVAVSVSRDRSSSRASQPTEMDVLSSTPHSRRPSMSSGLRRLSDSSRRVSVDRQDDIPLLPDGEMDQHEMMSGEKGRTHTDESLHQDVVHEMTEEEYDEDEEDDVDDVNEEKQRHGYISPSLGTFIDGTTTTPFMSRLPSVDEHRPRTRTSSNASQPSATSRPRTSSTTSPPVFTTPPSRRSHNWDPITIENFLHSYVPRVERVSVSAGEMCFRLPLASANKFPEMLNALDQRMHQLCVVNYGVSVTTLEEVFIKVASNAPLDDEDDDLDKPTTSSPYTMSSRARTATTVTSPPLNATRSSSDDGLSHCINDEIPHHAPTLTRRATWSDARPLAKPRRRASSGVDVEDRPWLKTLEASPDSVSFWRMFSALIIKRWHISKRDKRALVCQYFIPIALLLLGLGLLRIPPDYNFPLYELNAAAYNDPCYTTVGDTLAPSFINSLALESHLSLQPIHANSTMGMSQSLLKSRFQHTESQYGAFYHSKQDDDYTYRMLFNVTALHAPMVFLAIGNSAMLRAVTNDSGAYIKSSIHPFPFTHSQQEYVYAGDGILASICITFAFSFIPASFAVFIVTEREQNSKHLQFISGVSMLSYWISNLVWDLIQFMIPAMIAAAIVYMFQNPNFVGENFPVVMVSFLLYGVSIIPFTYLCSFLFRSHSTAQIVMILVYLFGGTVFAMVCTVMYILPVTSVMPITGQLRHIFRIIPSFCLGDAMFYLNLRGTGLNDLYRLSPWNFTIVGWDLIYMGAQSIIYFSLVLLIELVHSYPHLLSVCRRDPIILNPESTEDSDVEYERERIQKGVCMDDPIRLEGLRKTYRPAKLAVKDLYFSVPQGECFGFLGVNGAGKTTTLKMITGDVKPTSGRVFLGGMDTQLKQRAVRRIMGYCPQFDALHANMTGIETLYLYGRIRGIPDHQLPEMVHHLIERLALTEYANRPAGQYSGGNKRKLSVAIALIGSPKVVFLDEPSTGMDPVSRRWMWDFISETMSTRAVILTTHSMDECEALANRVGILSHGALCCVGTSQHLKSRYGGGYQLDVSCSPHLVDRVRTFVTSTFPDVVALECHGGHAKYQIPSSKLHNLAYIFTQIETHKKEYGITHYSVGQTSLEQIFLYFSNRDDDIAENTH